MFLLSVWLSRLWTWQTGQSVWISRQYDRLFRLSTWWFECVRRFVSWIEYRSGGLYAVLLIYTARRFCLEFRTAHLVIWISRLSVYSLKYQSGWPCRTLGANPYSLPVHLDGLSGVPHRLYYNTDRLYGCVNEYTVVYIIFYAA